MSDHEYQCKGCGHRLDGEMPMHDPPVICPECGCPEIEDAELAEEREAENKAINAHDEYLKDIL